MYTVCMLSCLHLRSGASELVIIPNLDGTVCTQYVQDIVTLFGRLKSHLNVLILDDVHL